MKNAHINSLKLKEEIKKLSKNHEKLLRLQGFDEEEIQIRLDELINEIYDFYKIYDYNLANTIKDSTLVDDDYLQTEDDLTKKKLKK